MNKLSKEDLKWQAKSDLDTLRRADEIRQDSKRFNRAQKEAQAQIKSISAISNLRKTK